MLFCRPVVHPCAKAQVAAARGVLQPSQRVPADRGECAKRLQAPQLAVAVHVPLLIGLKQPAESGNKQEQVFSQNEFACKRGCRCTATRTCSHRGTSQMQAALTVHHCCCYPQEERAAYELQDEEDRPAFLPRAFDSLRRVPMYSAFIKERFERCLDLYLCPRTRRRRLEIKDPESLVPKLPAPRDLQPFPTTCLLRFIGHTGKVGQ